MVAPVQLHTKPALAAADATDSDRIVVLDASNSYAVMQMTLAELTIYVTS